MPSAHVWFNYFPGFFFHCISSLSPDSPTRVKDPWVPSLGCQLVGDTQVVGLINKKRRDLDYSYVRLFPYISPIVIWEIRSGLKYWLYHQDSTGVFFQPQLNSLAILPHKKCTKISIYKDPLVSVPTFLPWKVKKPTATIMFSKCLKTGATEWMVYSINMEIYVQVSPGCSPRLCDIWDPGVPSLNECAWLNK